MGNRLVAALCARRGTVLLSCRVMKETKIVTIAEEHYLKCIHLAGGFQEPVSVKVIAVELGASQASIAEMLKKLQQKQLVQYKPYLGVELTTKGKQLARKTIRVQRLWEVFLVDKLQLSWDEVHEATEELEHVRSEKVIERLDAFLGFPKYDPHGDPIPDLKGDMLEKSDVLLNEIRKGQNGVISGVLQQSKSFLQHLNQLGLRIGTPFTVKNHFPFDGSLEIFTENRTITLSREVSSQIRVVPGKMNKKTM